MAEPGIHPSLLPRVVAIEVVIFPSTKIPKTPPNAFFCFLNEGCVSKRQTQK
jgi:hypothetical protein